MTLKNFRCTKINCVNFVYLVINKTIEESNGNKYLMLVPTDECKYILEKYQEQCTKIKDLIRSKTNSSGSYVEK